MAAATVAAAAGDGAGEESEGCLSLTTTPVGDERRGGGAFSNAFSASSFSESSFSEGDSESDSNDVSSSSSFSASLFSEGDSESDASDDTLSSCCSFFFALVAERINWGPFFVDAAYFLKDVESSFLRLCVALLCDEPVHI